MADETLKEAADRLMEKEGNVKGEAIKADLDYIKMREGEEGVEKLEKTLEELGYPLEKEKIQSLKSYREGKSVLVEMLSWEIFDWDENDIFEMGRYSAKKSLIFRVLLKYFSSPGKIAKEAPKYWRKHFDFGSLEIENYDENKREMTLKIKGYDFHPVMCHYFTGMFHALFSLSVKSKEVKIEEEKCIYKGDDCHQFKLKW